MRVFARRSPSFSDVERVAITFENEDSRTRLIRASGGIGLLVVVGLSHEPTPSPERGRLLGLVEFAPAPVALSELFDGELSWAAGVYDPPPGPHAVPVLRAWSFDAPLMRASDAFQDPLSIDPTERVVELMRAEADLVRVLPKTEVQAPYEALRRQSYALAKSLQCAAPTTGPRPVSWTGEVTHDPNAEAWTYLMQFGERNVWKIGHTQDIERRLEELNHDVPHEALNERWALVRSKQWDSSVHAYEMEQDMLLALASYRTVGERVGCEKEVLFSMWEHLADREGAGGAGACTSQRYVEVKAGESPESRAAELLRESARAPMSRLDRIASRALALLKESDDPQREMKWAEDRLFEEGLLARAPWEAREANNLGLWTERAIAQNPDLVDSLFYLECRDIHPEETAETFENLILSLIPSEGGL